MTTTSSNTLYGVTGAGGIITFCANYSGYSVSVNDPNGHYLPKSLTSISSSPILLEKTLYSDVSVKVGSTSAPEGVALYVLDKRANRIGPFLTRADGVAHVASVLVNTSEANYRILVEDARYERYEGAYSSPVTLTERSVCAVHVQVQSGTKQAESDFTVRLAWGSGSLLQGAEKGETTFSFDCGSGPERGESFTLECTDRAGKYEGEVQQYEFAGEPGKTQEAAFSVSAVARVGVQVRDATTKLPVAGALVELLAGGTALGTAETDAGGLARFVGSETSGMVSDMVVRCAAAGYEEEEEFVSEGEDATVDLKQATARSLTVVVSPGTTRFLVRATSGVESVAGETESGKAELRGYFTGAL